MQAAVRVAIRDLEPATAGRRVDFELGELPPAHGDTAMLQQVWANLLGNAVKYTAPRDRAVITIGAELRDGVTVYFVRDNGVGFDMQYVDKLFGAFQRLHGSEFPAPASGSPLSGELSPAMAAAPGRRARSKKGQPSSSPLRARRQPTIPRTPRLVPPAALWSRNLPRRADERAHSSVSSAGASASISASSSSSWPARSLSTASTPRSLRLTARVRVRARSIVSLKHPPAWPAAPARRPSSASRSAWPRAGRGSDRPSAPAPA